MGLALRWGSMRAGELGLVRGVDSRIPAVACPLMEMGEMLYME